MQAFARLIHGAVILLAALTLGLPRPGRADVVRVVVDRREVLLGGQAFGDVGAYEKIVGRIFFEFDPDNPANALVVDLQHAPRNGAGRVEAWADLMVLQPREAGRRSGLAWLEVGSAGRKVMLESLNLARFAALDPTRAEDLGDGLLMEQGLTLIWVGWQWDVPDQEGLLRLHIPLVRLGAEALAGTVRADWTLDEPAPRLALGHRGHRAYLPANPESDEHVLLVRSDPLAEREVVPREAWRFVRGYGGESEILTWIELEGGFEEGRIYELVYRSEHPRVVGLGLAAVRDVMSYAKYGLRSEFPAETGIAFGVSDGARFLRHFLHEGFNTDERGRKVFDGMLIHGAGAGRGSFNHRFAQPARDTHPSSTFFFPIDLFPFTGRATADPVAGLEGGLWDRTPERQRPLVFHTNTGYEYWGRAASLTHTTVDGAADVAPLPEERIYHLVGGQHAPSPFPPPPGSRFTDVEAYSGSPLDYLPVLRALSVRLNEWVTEGREPPPSRYPTLSEGELVPPGALAFPPIPGVEAPRSGYRVFRADYGPRWVDQGIVDVEPPSLGAPFTSLVPQVDGLGNELGGVRTAEARVPLATYAPWHLGSSWGDEARRLSDLIGTFVPLPWTEEERSRTGDPRPSVESLYGSKERYMRRVREAVEGLTAAGLLLPQDARRVAERADTLWEWLAGGRARAATAGPRVSRPRR